MVVGWMFLRVVLWICCLGVVCISRFRVVESPLFVRCFSSVLFEPFKKKKKGGEEYLVLYYSLFCLLFFFFFFFFFFLSKLAYETKNYKSAFDFECTHNTLLIKTAATSSIDNFLTYFLPFKDFFKMWKGPAAWIAVKDSVL